VRLFSTAAAQANLWPEPITLVPLALLHVAAFMSPEMTKCMPLQHLCRRLRRDLLQRPDLAQIPVLVQHHQTNAQACRILVEFFYSHAFQPCLTENIRRLGFALVRVDDQRDSRAEYFQRNWRSFQFRYQLSALSN
jgi:hypothetical protein